MSSFPTLKQIFDNPAVVAAILFCIAAAFGQVMHAVKKALDGEVNSPIAWMSSNWRRTASAFIANAGGMAIFVQSGVLTPILAVPNGWWAICLFGFYNGFTADSALNKATRSAWSPEKREAAKP